MRRVVLLGVALVAVAVSEAAAKAPGPRAYVLHSVIGAVFGGGIAGTIDIGDVLELARKQQARIAHLPH